MILTSFAESSSTMSSPVSAIEEHGFDNAGPIQIKVLFSQGMFALLTLPMT